MLLRESATNISLKVLTDIAARKGNFMLKVYMTLEDFQGRPIQGDQHCAMEMMAHTMTAVEQSAQDVENGRWDGCCLCRKIPDQGYI
jgi:hypothetical protein